jgi:hypothetical protein
MNKLRSEHFGDMPKEECFWCGALEGLDFGSEHPSVLSMSKAKQAVYHMGTEVTKQTFIHILHEVCPAKISDDDIVEDIEK